ncbi:replication region DNA-binding N-term [Pseudomonas benzenivorans]|nr:DNA-binding protein [Pseudomonas benzenivorans]SDG38980.1 replication region DNA-binding N-term [Pseudomonas benzenivorans]
MARGGINKAIVQKARNALLTRGVHPSIDAVRIELGNTGSKTTIHRYLKELESVEQAISSDALSAPLTGLIEQLLGQLKAEAQQSVAQAHEALLRERAAVQQQTAVLEVKMRDLELKCTDLALELQASQKLIIQEQQQRQAVEADNVQISQSRQDLEVRLRERDERIKSLEKMHQHTRDALEHYRQANKVQREQEQRRQEAQTSQLQAEIRQLRQMLILKQDELTQLNRDNERLLTEARHLQKEQHEQQKLVLQRTLALEELQSALTYSEHLNEALGQECKTLQREVSRLGEASAIQIQQMQDLQARLIEATSQLNSLEKQIAKKDDKGST